MKRALLLSAAVAATAATIGGALVVQLGGAAPVAVEQGDTMTLNCPTGVPATTNSDCLVVAVVKPTATTSTSIATTSTSRPPTPTSTAPTTTAAPTTTVAPPAGVQFSENFASPNSVDRFVYQRIHGVPNVDPSTQAVTWHGDHDMSCGNPNQTVRGPIRFGATTPPMVPFSAMGEHVYYCQPASDPALGHLMTAQSSDAYAHLDFMPNQIFQDVRKVCFDVNWTDLGGRKWIQVAVVPEAYFQANGRRMSYARPLFEKDGNVAAAAVVVDKGTFLFLAFRSVIETSTAFPSGRIVKETYGSGFRDSAHYLDKAPRFTQCIEDLKNGTVKITRPNFPAELNGPETRIQTGAFPAGPSRVIFEDVTYDDPKGDGAIESRVTWHWDNIQIS